MGKIHCIISYDIVDNKRRRKLVGILEGYAVRVQYSVFEGFLSRGQLKKAAKESTPYVKPSEGDSLRIYIVCAACYPKTFLLGGIAPDWDQAIIA